MIFVRKNCNEDQNDYLSLEDDSFGEIYFEDAVVPPPIKSFDKDGHVIYIKGFSKTLAPGLRIAHLLPMALFLSGYMQ